MKSREYRYTQIFANTICFIIILSAILPFIMLIIASFTDNDWAAANGFTYFPGKWSMDAYSYIIKQWDIIGHAYLMTIIVTLLGTSISITITTLFAYGISKPNVPGMKVVSFILIFAMLFNGGLVSTYYCYAKIWNIKDTIWALIFPGLLMSGFNVILVRNYFTNNIPASLEEAARIDGANALYIFGSIVMPLSKPVLATIGLMTALVYWNDWANGLYYLTARGGSQYNTIQIILNNINNDIQALAQVMTSNDSGFSTDIKMPSTTIRMAIAVFGILPILVLYPFFQRYFVKGITFGGVKE